VPSLRPLISLCLLLFFSGDIFAQQNQQPQAPAAAPQPPSPPPGPTQAQVNAAMKAVADANQVLSNAMKLEVQTNTLINDWKGLPDAPTSAAQAIQTLEGIFQAVSSAADGPGLRSKLSSMSDSLKAQSDALSSKQKDLLVGGATTPTDDVKDLYNQCDSVSKDLAAEKTTLDNLVTSFTDPIQRNYDFFTASFNAVDSSLASLLQLNKDEKDADVVRQVLTSQLPVYASVPKDYSGLVSEWTKFSGRLKPSLPRRMTPRSSPTPSTPRPIRSSPTLIRFPGTSAHGSMCLAAPPRIRPALSAATKPC